MLNRFKKHREPATTANATNDFNDSAPNGHPQDSDAAQLEKEAGVPLDDAPVKFLTFRVFMMGVIVSIGGFIFGYDTGQISGFLEMPNFLRLFGDKGTPEKPAFSNVRSGAIVALLSIGTLIGAVIAAPVADAIGRKKAIIIYNLVFCVGVIVQISTMNAWYQIAIGRLVAGFGIGALSVLTPMYQSETAPKQVRGALVSCYQLFITLGIFLAYCINFATEAEDSRRAWRLPIGIGFLFPAIMITGILFLRESPRWDYRKGNIARAKTTLALSYGVSENHREVAREMREIREKFEAESVGGKQKAYEVFTGPRMMYRILLGVGLQALQQLTGANFFFYYGTTVFQATGLTNSYVTSMILGGVNFGCTFFGLYVVEKFGRRKSLIAGALWMSMCFFVFSSIGHFALDKQVPQNSPTEGTVMIVFACFFIAAFASTWGPIIWAVVGELYPSRYRAIAMGLATCSNWIFNFLLSFFTPFITGDIDYAYGYVFAACNIIGAIVVYFFLCESQGRSLEEIDTMYILHVNPLKSSKWHPEEGEELVTADKLHLEPGARNIRKEGPLGGQTHGNETVEKKESVVDTPANGAH